MPKPWTARPTARWSSPPHSEGGPGGVQPVRGRTTFLPATFGRTRIVSPRDRRATARCLRQGLPRASLEALPTLRDPEGAHPRRAPGSRGVRDLAGRHLFRSESIVQARGEDTGVAYGPGPLREEVRLEHPGVGPRRDRKNGGGRRYLVRHPSPGTKLGCGAGQSGAGGRGRRLLRSSHISLEGRRRRLSDAGGLAASPTGGERRWPSRCGDGTWSSGSRRTAPHPQG
jgi:hypothetical protein